MGFSYNKIVELLGCSKSTISYHCKNESLEEPIKQIDDELIKNIRNESSVKRHSLPKYSKRELTKCINCGTLTKNKFCTRFCSSSHKHKEAYNDYLNNNDKYCNGGYIPKNFKDFFLNEQNNKCQICNIEPKWMNRELIFVIDHIDGDASNNKRENIRMICPNCDSQTETFKSKNKNSKRRNYWKEKIIKDIMEK